MNLPDITLPTQTESLPVERLRTGVSSLVTDAVHAGTWRAVLQDFYESDKHPSGMGSEECFQEPRWFGLEGTFEESKGKVAKLALHGWTEAAEACAALFRQVTAVHTSSFIQTMVPADEPGDVDVAAYLADSEQCFTSLAPSRLTQVGCGGIVTLEHEIFSSATVSSADIVMRGTVVAACVYMLERAGVRCKVIVRLTGNGHLNHVLRDHRITVKEAADPMHVGRLLYWLAHPSVHRVILFAIRLRLWRETNYSSAGHRSPISPHHIRTPGQVYGTDLETWLAKTLQDVGLTFK